MSNTTDTSSFGTHQPTFQETTPLITKGATSDCYRVKLYGKLHFLKRLKTEFSGDPRYRAAMRKEFETGYNLYHPHLVRYMSCGDDYLLTEWVDGSTLGEFVEQNPEFFKNRDRVSNLLDELLGCGKGTSVTHCVGVSVGVAESQVGELHLVAYPCDEDVVGLEVEVYNLV